MHEPEAEGERGAGLGALQPHAPRSDGHHQVKRGPDGAEDPARRVPRGFIDREIPRADTRARRDSADRGGGKCGDDKKDEGEPAIHGRQ